MHQPGSSQQKWTEFHLDKIKDHYPAWPMEAMVKCLFGRYLAKPIALTPASKVLDVGCGFGNNLMPFARVGCECFGVEISAEIAQLTAEILRKRGLNATIKEGRNTALPFPDDMFDLIVSIGVLHYEKDEASIHHALKEYTRVLKPDGALFLMTVGPKHEIQKRAEVIGPHQYRIRDYDFRDGEQYFYFDSPKYLEHYLSAHFGHVETGRVTEDLMTLKLDFLLAACQGKRPANRAL